MNILEELSQSLVAGAKALLVPSAAVLDAAGQVKDVAVRAVPATAAAARQQLAELKSAAVRGIAPAAALELPQEAMEFEARVTALKRWKLILESLDKSMAQRAGDAKLSQAVQVWGRAGGDMYDRSVLLLQSARDKAVAFDRLIRTGESPRAQEADAYASERKAALAAADKAETYAKKIQAAIEASWARFSSQGAPSATDFALAPVTGSVDAAKAAGAGAVRAAQVVSEAGGALVRAVPAAAERTEAILKWGAVGLAGFGALYLLSFLPRPHYNPPRTARRGGEDRGARRRRRRSR